MDGTFTSDGSRYTLRFERNLAFPVEKVWRVLTERELLTQWFPCDVEGEWSVGAALQFTFLHGEGEGLPEEDMRGEVLAVDPGKLLEFRWGRNVIRCELLPDGEGCRLLFSDTFDDASTGARSAVGWEACLDNLDSLLRGGELTKFAVEAWQTRFEHYAKTFEPEMGAQQGLPEDYPTN